jgi:hypothetical protein
LSFCHDNQWFGESRMITHTTFPEQHQRAMQDATDPIHRACDFFVQSSDDGSLGLVSVNQWLHSPEVWAPWPDFLVAFASQGCGDYFAYDLRRSPPSIIYIGPDATPEQHLADPESLRYSSFGEWYESQLERYTCDRCRSHDVRIEASQDKQWLLRICSDCGFEERMEAIVP